MIGIVTSQARHQKPSSAAFIQHEQKEKPMRATELCPTQNLKAFHIDGDTHVTIKGVGFERIDDTEKGVVYFKEFAQGLVINETNLNRLIEMLGDETNEWHGQKIVIYPTECRAPSGEKVPCIRVRGAKRVVFTESDEEAA